MNGQCYYTWTQWPIFLVTTEHRPFVWLIVWTMSAGSPLQNWRQNSTGVACHGLCINSLNGNDSLKRLKGYVTIDFLISQLFLLNHYSSCYKNTFNWPEFKDFKTVINAWLKRNSLLALIALFAWMLPSESTHLTHGGLVSPHSEMGQHWFR